MKKSSYNNLNKNISKLTDKNAYAILTYLCFQLRNVPEYLVLSELIFLLDLKSLKNLLGYYAGRTLKIPSLEEFNYVVWAVLLFQYTICDEMPMEEAIIKLKKEINTKFDENKVQNIYYRLLPYMSNCSSYIQANNFD